MGGEKNLASLKWNFRNIPAKYKKRAVCNSDIMFDILDEALKEKINMYMLVYIYNQHMYSVGYENKPEVTYYLYSEDKEVPETFDSIENLKKSVVYDHDITIIREFQAENLDILASIGVGYGGVGATIFLKAMEENDNVIECSLHDNFMLKNYLISNDSDRFNINLSNEQIDKFNQLQDQGEQSSKKTTIFLIGCVAFIVIIIILAALFGNS